MDNDQRELVNRLFVAATEILEDAMIAATAGQSPRLTSRRGRALAIQLRGVARALAAIAEAAQVAAGESPVQRSNGRRQPRR